MSELERLRAEHGSVLAAIPEAQAAAAAADEREDAARALYDAAGAAVVVALRGFPGAEYRGFTKFDADGSALMARSLTEGPEPSPAVRQEAEARMDEAIGAFELAKDELTGCLVEGAAVRGRLDVLRTRAMALEGLVAEAEAQDAAARRREEQPTRGRAALERIKSALRV